MFQNGHHRIIFHIDVNSAFLSWTAVKMVSEGKQDIRLVPSVISGDPSDRRSIVTAASMPAKKAGVKTAEPVTMAMRKCPGLLIVRGDRSWYRKCSEDFISICRKYSPVLQQFSIDECFLDMSLRCAGKDPVRIAESLKDEIRDKLGFTVNIGIGSNKLLAKMASDFEKPDKIHTLWEHEIRQKMWPLGVRDLLWVGKKTEERLTAYGIRTIGDLAGVAPAALSKVVGQKMAVQLHENANGIDTSPVETEAQEAKNFSAERTFSKDISTFREIDRALFNVACIVAHRIRKAGFRASCISVFIKHRDFSVSQRQRQISEATDVTAVILNEARRMVAEIWDGTTPVRQVGLGVSKLTHDRLVHLSLFEDPDMEYYREWDRNYDRHMDMEGQAAGFDKAKPSGKSRGAAEFRYPDGESALKAAKEAVKNGRNRHLEQRKTRDGHICFTVGDGSGIIEVHIIETGKEGLPHV